MNKIKANKMKKFLFKPLKKIMSKFNNNRMKLMN